jgi:hypothetical protein
MDDRECSVGTTIAFARQMSTHLGGCAFRRSPTLPDVDGGAKAGRMRLSCLQLIAGLALMGCSGTSVGTGTGDGGLVESDGAPAAANAPTANKFEALFVLPAKPTITPDSVMGVWAGWMKKSQQEFRVRITADGLVLGMQCRDGIVGIDVAAHVSPDTIRALEGRGTSTSGYCSMVVGPFQVDRCAGPESFQCFRLNGTTLTFENSYMLNSRDQDHPEAAFTKLSD